MQKNLKDRKEQSNMLTIDITAVAETQSRNEQLKHLHKLNTMVEENIEMALNKAFGKWWRATNEVLLVDLQCSLKTTINRLQRPALL